MNYKDFINEWRDASEYIQAFTSGSTGTPKVIKLLKSFVRESAVRTNTFFNLNVNSTFHSCISPDYIGGKMMAVRAEILGAYFSWEEPSNRPLKDFPLHQNISLLALVPSQMIHILENKDHLPHIDNIIIGGSPIHSELRKKIKSSGLNAFETYGMTETASHIALRKIEKEDVPFRVLPGISIEKDAEDCLVISFANKYKVFTNDIVEIYDTEYFIIKGRKDHMIITGGKKVNPMDLESKISELIKADFYISSREDEKWGQKIILVIEGEESGFDKKEILKNLSRYVLPWEMPKEILFKKKLERTHNGKILRKGYLI